MKLNGENSKLIRTKKNWKNWEKLVDILICFYYYLNMKRFALLKLKWNANVVICETGPCTKEQAISEFQSIFKTTNGETLDKDGYLKQGEITFTIAEYFS